MEKDMICTVTAGLALMADGTHAVMLMLERDEERQRLVVDPAVARHLAELLETSATMVESLEAAV